MLIGLLMEKPKTHTKPFIEFIFFKILQKFGPISNESHMYKVTN